MAKDVITDLLERLVRGEVSIKDARAALSESSLTEEQMEAAIDHGVFNPADPGTIISASLAPSGTSYLTIFFFVWGIFWTLYWAATTLYGLFNHWAQEQLSYHLAMALTTLILMGVIYLRFVLPDKIIVKERMNKYIREHTKDWQEYRI
jgi:hypothetical protein